MVKTAEIISKPKNYLPLALFAAWVIFCTFEYSTPVISNPWPFLFIGVCIGAYKVNLWAGKLATGILIVAYMVSIFKIAPSEGIFKLGLTINSFWLGIKFKTAGIIFFIIYCIVYKDTPTYQKVSKGIGNGIRNSILFMINPNKK